MPRSKTPSKRIYTVRNSKSPIAKYCRCVNSVTKRNSSVTKKKKVNPYAVCRASVKNVPRGRMIGCKGGPHFIVTRASPSRSKSAKSRRGRK